MTPAELARVRKLADVLRLEPSVIFKPGAGRGPEVRLAEADRDAVCEALTALADKVERLETQHRRDLDEVARLLDQRGRIDDWLEEIRAKLEDRP